MDEIEVQELINKSKRKDTRAFKLLVENYQQYAFSLAIKLVCNEEDAKDIVQESFVKVWQHLKRYHPKSKFSTWLYKIVYNTALDKIKMNKRRMDKTSYTNYLSEGKGQEIQKNPEQKYVEKDLAEKITLLAEHLTPKQQAVFVLRDLQGAEIDEIVVITGLSKNKVKSNLYCARKNIRMKLIRMETLKQEYHEMQ